MRNLIAFLRRFQVFLIFMLLQIFALSTYFTFLNFPRAQYMTSASYVAGKMLNARNEVTKYVNLGKTSNVLQKQNKYLREKLPMSYIRMENGWVKINDTLFHQQYEYIPGKVINSTVTRANNFFTLNIGWAQGVKRGMGVFSDKGVVGIIHISSEHFSVVKSVLTEDINIDVQIEPIGLFGLLKWDGRDPRRGQISGISNDLNIKRWSKVVTRSGSGIFPYGIPVGKVEKLKTVEGKPIWDVIIRYAEDFRTLQRVYVVRNLLLEEQQKLESLIPEDEENE
ncbi:MAG: rod shape-determining protein MreC [Bacteroidetes bacterium]|nr:MAG: rod shape-determining protein MreC [Bacteroidota bacterium]